MIYPWQQALWKDLLQWHASGRLPHALLFHGREGLGQLECVLLFAHYMLCEEPTLSQPCFKCQACQWIAAGTHPDLLRLHPEGEKKGIYVEPLRALKNFVYQTSHGGKYRIVLIEPAEAMNISASNALLKILEEPAAHTLLFLVSYHAGWLPLTLRSRCQTVYCKPATVDECMEAFPHLSKIDLQFLYTASLEAPLGLKGDRLDVYKKVRTAWVEALDAFLNNERSMLSQTMSLHLLNVAVSVEILLGFCHDLVVLSQTHDLGFIRNKDLGELFVKLTEKLGHVTLYRLYDKLKAMRHCEKKAIPINTHLWVEDLWLSFKEGVL